MHSYKIVFINEDIHSALCAVKKERFATRGTVSGEDLGVPSVVAVGRTVIPEVKDGLMMCVYLLRAYHSSINLLKCKRSLINLDISILFRNQNQLKFKMFQ